MTKVNARWVSVCSQLTKTQSHDNIQGMLGVIHLQNGQTFALFHKREQNLELPQNLDKEAVEALVNRRQRRPKRIWPLCMSCRQFF